MDNNFLQRLCCKVVSDKYIGRVLEFTFVGDVGKLRPGKHLHFVLNHFV